MKVTARRLFQALLYEAIALAVVGPALASIFDRGASTSLGLAVACSGVALAWSYVFNGLFERWEARQAIGGRSVGRRILHGFGFEGGLTVFLVPLISVWLDVSLAEAFVADLGILLFFLAYAIVFTWAFDKLFGLPASAAPR